MSRSHGKRFRWLNMIIGASRPFSKGIYEDCKYDYRRKPPFLKGRFGGNVNMNSGSADVNMIGGSADSLSLNPRVRL
jgi:hypothetical protein